MCRVTIVVKIDNAQKSVALGGDYSDGQMDILHDLLYLLTGRLVRDTTSSLQKFLLSMLILIAEKEIWSRSTGVNMYFCTSHFISFVIYWHISIQ